MHMILWIAQFLDIVHSFVVPYSSIHVPEQTVPNCTAYLYEKYLQALVVPYCRDRGLLFSCDVKDEILLWQLNHMQKLSEDRLDYACATHLISSPNCIWKQVKPTLAEYRWCFRRIRRDDGLEARIEHRSEVKKGDFEILDSSRDTKV